MDSALVYSPHTRCSRAYIPEPVFASVVFREASAGFTTVRQAPATRAKQWTQSWKAGADDAKTLLDGGPHAAVDCRVGRINLLGLLELRDSEDGAEDGTGMIALARLAG